MIKVKKGYYQPKIWFKRLISNVFLICFSHGNNLFQKRKHFVSSAETKCFDYHYTYETKSSFHRRWHLNEPKKRQERPEIHFWCIDDYLLNTSIHCLSYWITKVYKENVGMYREIKNSEWKKLQKIWLSQIIVVSL